VIATMVIILEPSPQVLMSTETVACRTSQVQANRAIGVENLVEYHPAAG
jgi:hypothetical protein